MIDGAALAETEPAEPFYEPWLFVTMLSQLTSGEANIDFIYSILDLLAQRYELSDVVAVLKNETLGFQSFRLGRQNVPPHSAAGSANAPGVFTEPEDVPDVVARAVVSVCEVALAMQLARYGADHDPLTGIANRRNFNERLRTAAVRSSRYNWAFTLVLIDLDGFKEVNDRSGHAAGDDLLRTFGAALRRSVRSGDSVARIGGDEFAVILCNTEGTEVLAFVERLRSELLSAPDLRFTFGTAAAPGDSTDPTELSRLADARLYEKKGKVA